MATTTVATQTTTTFSFEGMTYKQAIKHALQHVNGLQGRITLLNDLMEPTISSLTETSLIYTAKKENATLDTFMKKRYETFKSILEVQQVAKEALDLLGEAFKYCSPSMVSLSIMQIDHLTKMGYNMEKYAHKELKLVTGVSELSEKIFVLETLIQRTTAYVAAYPSALNDAARYLKQTQRKACFVDNLPKSLLLSATKYFDEGFKQYQTPSPTTTTTTTSTTTVESTQGK